MKKVLIVICDMKIGGAQRSLLSFLQEFSASGYREDYDVHILPLNPTGEYMAQIPERIHVRLPGRAERWMGKRMNADLLLRHFSWRGLLGEALWICRKALPAREEKLNIQQRIWRNWKRFVPELDEEFDVAVAYIDGVPAYYVMDKVKAGKKVIWLHSDYEKQAYDPAFDAPYYRACDAAVTVSEECRAALCRALPESEDKTCVLENISSCSILEKSREGACPEYADREGWRLLSVGRLHVQKGMDIAVEAAQCLRREGIRFTWLIVGEGSERARLQEQIQRADLCDCVKLIGSRENPYQYMQECDIMVQPSRVEGKSIVLDEAKMLNKPIVVTNYPSAADAIEQEQTGLIVEMNAAAVSRGILRMMQDEALRERIQRNLQLLPKGNEQELSLYIEKMF